MENEFDILNRRMEQNLEKRHTYLMFGFTTAIASLAVFSASNLLKEAPWLCIMPFAVIIPFQARISYSRLTHAKMEAYICAFYPNDFEYLAKQVKDLRGIIGKIIAIIVNYELSLLSIALDMIYVILAKKTIGLRLFLDAECIAIIGLTMVVIMLATYTFPYDYFLRKYISEYERIKG